MTRRPAEALSELDNLKIRRGPFVVRARHQLATPFPCTVLPPFDGAGGVEDRSAPLAVATAGMKMRDTGRFLDVLRQAIRRPIVGYDLSLTIEILNGR